MPLRLLPEIDKRDPVRLRGGDLIGEICRSQGFEVIECREDCRTYAPAIGSFLRRMRPRPPAS